MKNILKENEFFEGVDNLLVKKGKTEPNWMFSDLHSVSEELVDKLLAPSKIDIQINI